MNGMLVHGYNADDLLKSILISIPKDVRGSLSDCDNYKGIALCSPICKVIDYVTIYKYGNELHTSPMQFACKQDHSTIMWTSIFQEVINYYNRNGSKGVKQGDVLSASLVCIYMDDLWPLLLTWFNFNPSMDM